MISWVYFDFSNQKPILRKEVQNLLIFEIRKSTKISLTVWIDAFQLFLDSTFHWTSQRRLQIMESAAISIRIRMSLNMNPIDELLHGLDIYQTEFSGPPAADVDRLDSDFNKWLIWVKDVVRWTLASDVEEGGGTAFVAANVMAKPIKGSAVFWMLTAEDGRTNKKTVHAGTEILLTECYTKTAWCYYNL